MKFLIDENIQNEIVEFLKKSGYDVIPVPSGISNGEVIQLSKRENRILLTHDKHFSDILLYPPENCCGIIRIKIHPPIISDIIRSLKILLHKMTLEQIDKHLIILEKDGFRIYPH